MTGDAMWWHWLTITTQVQAETVPSADALIERRANEALKLAKELNSPNLGRRVIYLDDQGLAIGEPGTIVRTQGNAYGWVVWDDQADQKAHRYPVPPSFGPLAWLEDYEKWLASATR